MCIRLAVIICTHNRISALEDTLQSLLNVIIPDGVRLNVLVVANCCTDETVSRCRQHSFNFDFDVIEESNAGLSHARNAGLQEARRIGADWVIWADDDVRFDPDFLSAYAEAFSSVEFPVVCGGRILPHFVDPSPNWLETAVDVLGLSVFSCLDLGVQPRAIPKNDALPFGANMAIRMSAIGGLQFDPNLGVTPTRKVGHEETAFVRSLLGESSWLYVPGALVYHVMPPRRQSVQAIRQFFFAQGVADAILHPSEPQDVSLLWGRPRWAIRRLMGLWWSGLPYFLFNRVDARLLRVIADYERIRGYVHTFSSDDHSQKNLIR